VHSRRGAHIPRGGKEMAQLRAAARRRGGRGEGRGRENANGIRFQLGRRTFSFSSFFFFLFFRSPPAPPPAPLFLSFPSLSFPFPFCTDRPTVCDSAHRGHLSGIDIQRLSINTPAINVESGGAAIYPHDGGWGGRSRTDGFSGSRSRFIGDIGSSSDLFVTTGLRFECSEYTVAVRMSAERERERERERESSHLSKMTPLSSL